MKMVLQTAPIIECISLSELKLHLRVDSGSFAGNIDETISIAPGSHVIADNYTTHAGTAVEVLGYTAVVVASFGVATVGGVVDVKIQEADASGGPWTDWATGAFTQVTISATASTQEKAYTGTKRYIRTVAKVITQNSEFGTTIIRLTATSVEDDLLDAIITSAREHIEDITSRALLTQTWDYYLDEFPSGNSIKIPFGNLATVTHVKYKNSAWTETNMTKALTAFAASDITPLTKTKVTSAAHDFDDGDTVYISGTTSYNGAQTVSNSATNTFDITVVYVANDATGMATENYIVETNGEGIGRIVLPYGVLWPSFTAYPSNPIVIRFICGWTTAALVPYKIKAVCLLIAADLYSNREGQVLSGHDYKENKAGQRLLASARLWDEF